MNLYRALSVLVLVSLCAAVTACSPNMPELPAHVVAADSPLPPREGRRVQIDSSDADLTREECSALIEAYRDRAAPDGQISVHKPSQILDGKLTPWCVENFDGKGVRFNDNMF